LPLFGGQKGPEITQNLNEIDITFNRHLMELRKVKESILDVKATSWHEDYNRLIIIIKIMKFMSSSNIELTLYFSIFRFRSAVKEMEVMMINVINSTFDTVTYVEQGVEILDAFMHLSAREVRLFNY
jgi:dynein heavy chain